MSLFDYLGQASRPLADRMRPRTLEEFLGQEHLVGKGRLLRRAIEADQLSSSIFYGPPGCGKTTLAYVISQTTKGHFERLNAVTTGVGEVRAVIQAARDRRSMHAQHTYLLLDECHRWNKAQSDSILPAIEEGVIRFIGSTTENPMVSMTPAIVSRCRVFQFFRLSDANVRQAVKNAISDRERGVGDLNVRVDEDALNHWVQVAAGDVRTALNALELAVLTTPTDRDGLRITRAIAEDSIQKPMMRVDETLYYDMLSAFCKSLRGSDPDAALLWASRLLYAGCDPKLIVRRVITHSSEDVGLADPFALVLANAAAEAADRVGLPEARIVLSEAVLYLAAAPKSNSAYRAVDAATAAIEAGDLLPVPEHLRPDGRGYLYPHDDPRHWVPQAYLTEPRRFWRPGRQGAEARMVERLRGFWKRFREEGEP